MLRRLIVAAAVCLLAAAGPVYALGLGEIQVDSRLNQRFSAVIPFASLSKDEAGNVRARLADNSAFARAGIERSGYVGSIQVEVVTEGGSPRIVLSSKEIAREPLLSLMIEVSTPGGPRILREYTVFLDPPISAQTPAPTPKALPVPSTSSVAPAAAPPARVAAAPESEFFQTPEETGVATQSRPAASADPTRYGPIRPGDTLWLVAQAVKPSGVGLDQAMLALYETNPGAFINGDIDNLRKGATLKVPSAERMKSLSNAAARARVNELSSQTPSATPTVAAPAVTEPAPAPAAAAAVSPAPAAAAISAPVPATEPAPAVAETPASAPADSPATAPIDAATPPPPATEAAATPAVETPATAPAVPVEAAAEPASTPVPETEQKDWLQMLLPFLIGLIVLLIGVAAFRAMRDRKAQKDYEEASRATPSAPVKRAVVAAAAAAPVRSARAELEELDRKLESVDEDATRVSAPAAAAVDDDRTRIEAATTGRFPRYTGGEIPASAAPRQPDKAEIEVSSRIQANTTEIDLGDNDPMSEADFHLAYGLYDEAALMLQQASAKNPGRTELKVKLAETYFAAGKPREFEQTAAQLQGKVGAEGWSKIAIMGRQLCPESVLFKDSGASAGDMSVDMSFDEDATIAPVSVDKGLEFNIDELELPTQVAEAAASKADPGLEFDLGEFDLGGAAKPQSQSSGRSVDLKDFDLDGTQLTAGPAKSDLDVRLDEIEPLVLDDTMDSDTVVGHDEAGTKLDLARAYVEMGDTKMARSLLDEVEQSGTSEQKREASALRERLLG